MRAGPIRPGLRAPLLLVVAWLACFSPALVGGRVLSFRDLFHFHAPMRFELASALRSGRLPLLDDAIGLGQPALANPNWAVLYPGNLLYLGLPFATAFNWSLALHVLWAGLGVRSVLGRAGCGQAAALAGAVAFAFSGPLLSALTCHNLLLAASWMPWVLGLLAAALDRERRALVLAALAVAALLLTGEPTLVLVTALGSTVVVARRLRPAGARPSVASRAALIVLLAAGLAAAQLVPQLLWLGESGRGAGLPFRASAAWWSLHPLRFLELVAPHHHGNPRGERAEEFWGQGLSDAGLPYVLKLYLGFLPLLVAPLAASRPLGRAALAGFALAQLLSLGHHLPGYRLLYQALWPLRLVRYPEKLQVAAALALAVAVGLGLERLRGGYRPPRRLLVFGLALAAAPLAALALDPGPSAGLDAVQRGLRLDAALASAAAGLATVGLVALAGWAGGTGVRRLALALAPALLFADLAAWTFDIAKSTPRPELERRPLLLTEVPELAGAPVAHLGEVQADRYFAGGRAPLAAMHELLQPRHGLLFGVAYGVTADVDRMGWRRSAGRERLLDEARRGTGIDALAALGVAHLVSLEPLPESPRLRLRSRLAPPGVGPVWVYAVDRPAPLVRLDGGPGRLEWQRPVPERYLVDVDAAAAGALVVGRNALPGWRARRGGRDVPVGATADGLLRVEVPAGRHRLELDYRPPGLAAGAAVSALAVFAVAVLWLVGAGREPAGTRPESASGPAPGRCRVPPHGRGGSLY